MLNRDIRPRDTLGCIRCNREGESTYFNVVLVFTHRIHTAQPFTNYFPRGDIHELLTPDLLHQLIKGTFKDHLVDWVTEYVRLSSDSEADADATLDEIDRR